MRRAFALAALIAIIAAACGGGGSTVATPSTSTAPSSPSPSGSATPSPRPSPGADLSKARVRLTQIAKLDGAPIAMAIRSGDDALFIAEREGMVVAIRGGQVDPTAVLDITDRVLAGGEQGLLGMTFSPDGRFMYVNYTDTNGDTNIVEYRMTGNRADKSSARRILLIQQPYSNHNGGNVLFGPDGYLYIGMGDGGSQGDPDGNGQNLGVLLAKMLRIDPRPSGGKPYGIPPDNPFVRRKGARPEVWAYGLRNPWRWEFDRETADLWIGDVGGSDFEEVDFQPADSMGGENYGWNLTEGTELHADKAPGNWVRPVFEYPTHSDHTCAIVGGFVYRGTAIPNLVGAYLYSDNCNGTINAFVMKNGKATGRRSLGVDGGIPSSFGQDQKGELYVLSLAGPIYKIEPA